MLEEKAKTVMIYVNGTALTFETRNVTGLEIKTRAGLDPNSELYRKTGSHLKLISNDEKVELHEGEQFVDFPPTPVS